MLKKPKDNIAVVGGGIAGSLASELLSRRGYKVTLFERHQSLGGCSGSFVREGFSFNVGATTIAGLKVGFPVEKILSTLKVKENIREIDPSIVVHTPMGTIRRFSCLHNTIEELERIFPNRKNYDFWKKVYEVTHVVLSHDYYHNFSSMKGCIKTLMNMKSLIFKYAKPFFIPAEKGLKKYFPNLDEDYYYFMDSHVAIVAQSSISNVSFLTLLLSLGYPFTGVGYPEGGMDSLFREIVKNPFCLLNSEVETLKRKDKSYVLRGNFGEEIFNRVILAFPALENVNIIRDDDLRRYLLRYAYLNNDNSAVVVYGVIKDFNAKESFHLKIMREPLPDTSSMYLFFSFRSFKKENSDYTIFTISTHTKSSYWINLKKELYDMKKEKLTKMILKVMKETFGLKSEQIIMHFMATPETFFKYIRRRSLGGIPVTRKNTFWRIPSNFTPFENLYLAGDNFFCYQGWIGISVGIRNLVENFS